MLRDLAGLLERRGEDVVIGKAAGRNTDLDGTRGPDPLGREEQLGGALRTDRRLQHVTAGAFGHEAKADERKPQTDTLAQSRRTSKIQELRRLVDELESLLRDLESEE